MTKHHDKINGPMAMQTTTTRAARRQTTGAVSGEGRPGVLRKILQAALVLLTLGWAAGAHAAGSTISLGAAPNPVIVGQPLTLSASVAAASPKGTVTFMSGGTTLGTATVSGGVATLSYTFTSAGSYSLTAVYNPITISRAPVSIGAFTSPTVALTVNKAPTTTAVVATPSPSTVGQPATITATVTGYNPSGTVTFYDGATAIGTGSISNGTATLTYTFTTAVVHNLTASYPGDANNLSSTSSAFAQTVNKAPTTTTVAATPSPSTVGQSATITATVTGYLPGGTVTFMDGTTTLGTGTIANGTATLTYTFTTAAVHNLTASYAGDANNLASTSSAFAQTVNKAPTTTTVAATPSPSTVGQAATLTATVTGYLPGGTVTFMDGTTTLGTGTIANGTATLTYTFTTAAVHNLTASYAGDANNLASTSSAFAQTVNKAPTTTTVAVTPSPSTVGQQATITATVTGYQPGGTVTFMDGTTTLGTGTIANGTAILSYTFTAVGAHNLTASYPGDANNLASTSSAFAQTVNKAPTTTTVVATPSPSTVGQADTLTATVTGYLPGGAVTFMDGTTTLGTGTIANGTATLSYTFTTGGAHSLTGVYAGDANNAASTSAAVSETVNAVATTTTLASTPNPSTPGQAVALTAAVKGYQPTGTVTFMDGATQLGTGALANGAATLSYAFTAGGVHSLTAVYGGDAGNLGSTSAAVAQTVAKATTTATLSISQNPPTVCTPDTLTATVTGSSPTGTVTFMDGTTALGTAPLDATGKATFSATFSDTYSHSLWVSYGGDGGNLASTSAQTPVSVGMYPTTVTLVDTPNPSLVNQSVTLTATFHVASCVNISGTAMFGFSNSGAVGSAPLVPVSPGVYTATYTLTFPNAGQNAMSAGFGGNGPNKPAWAQTTQVVNKITSVTTLAATPNPSAPTQSVTLTATVAGSSPTGTVTFYDGTTALRTITLGSGGTATWTQAFTTLGAHNLSASYSGDSYNTVSTSAAVNQTVALANTATTLVPSISPSAMSQAVTLTATVAGGYKPTGAITFYDGTTPLGTATVESGSAGASLSVTFTTQGAHSLTASYSGDVYNTPSTSAAVNQTVGRADSATALTASPGRSAPSQAVTLTATVTGSSPTGTITFLDGTTALGTATLANGAASLSYAFTATGTHTLTASYGGDANNAPSTSPVTSQGVATTATVYYIQPDQLGTPRTITDTSGNVVWQWDNADPFGNNVPNENPSNQGTFHFNLRFPGQYYDTETNLAYNVNRDYDAGIGRYVESDPIGLRGGSFSTFAYVENDPLTNVDAFGLSYLVYNNRTHTLTVYDESGNVVGEYPAANNAQSSSRGSWGAGTYNWAYDTTHPDDGPNSAFGSNGNTVFNVPGCTGCGVHSGRENVPDLAGRTGVNHATNGCIRTTDEATSAMRNLESHHDPITTLTVIR